MLTEPTPALRDVRGYRRTIANLPGYHAGRAPRNRGVKYPPTAPTPAEMVALLDACSGTLTGRRTRALLAILWRTGMRVGEALALEEGDLEPDKGALTIRRGKGDKRRVVGMDPWGWRELDAWLAVRRTLPVGPLICVVKGPTAGRPWADTSAREAFRALGAAAGIRKRIHPHALRHAFAVDWMRESGDVMTLQRQLGHVNLAVTTAYLRSVDPYEVVSTVAGRKAPMAPVPHLTM